MKHIQTWTFRQSWAKDILLCPERGRRSAFDPAFKAADSASDATTLGTALHEYAEGRLHGLVHGQSAADALAWLDNEIANETFEWVGIKTAKTLVAKLELMIQRFQGVMDDLIGQHGYPPTREIERLFNVPLSPDGTIRLSGAWDARWPASNVIHDWKTAARLDRYQQWEIDRWYVQPTFYSVGSVIVDLIDACGNEHDAMELFWSPDFTFECGFVFDVVDKSTNANHMSFPTTRNKGHAAWLLEQLQSFVSLHEHMPPDATWPKNDQHALCSDTWCPAYSTCKGQHFEGAHL